MGSNKISTFRQDYVPNSAMPIGTVLFIAYPNPPDGWLECNGQAISRTTYADLFGKLGTTYGTGNGTSTFNLPDLRGEFIRGWDNSKGVDSGRTFGTNQSDDLKSHTHTIPTRSNSNGGEGYAEDADSSGTAYSITSSAIGGTETRPRNVALMPIIKVLHVAGYDPQVNVTSNADTLDGLHASNFITKEEVVTKDLVFNFMNPIENQESGRFMLRQQFKLLEIQVLCSTAPLANTNIIVYKNGSTEIANFVFNSLSYLYDVSPDITLISSDIIHAKINGSPNGLDIFTVQLKLGFV